MPGKKGIEFSCEKYESEEHVLKALSSLNSTEEKLAALCKKYTDLLEDHKGLQYKFKQSQKSLTVIMKERDQLQNEHSKSILAKSKLESLCRELQKHNKLIKEESLARAREEEEKRKEVTNKFQTTINDIQTQMNDHYEKNTKLREENIELANKLKKLIEQYEEREQHIEKLMKHKDLEQQLLDAKLAQATLVMTEEKEKNLKEKELLLTDSQQSQKKIQYLESQEKQLRAQVGMYSEKYEEFQSTLTKSNEVFGSFKTEMEKMTKKIKKLEKETTTWKTRWENSQKSLIDMAEDKTRSDATIHKLNTKISRLENLCRALQSERKSGTPPAESSSEKSSSEQPSKDEAGAAAAEPSSDNADSTQTNGNTEIKPTKTPPNTPLDSSRNSPETVDGEQNSASNDEKSEAKDQESGGQSVQNEASTKDETNEEASSAVKEEDTAPSESVPQKTEGDGAGAAD